MKRFIDTDELYERIALNKNRLLTGDEYAIENVFTSVGEYDWKGDMEGRALLAYVSHYKIDGVRAPWLDKFFSSYTEKTCGKLYFEAPENSKGIISEQQLSGHSWLLRGLCEHYECFGDELSLSSVRAIVETLYLPIKDKIYTYPVNREKMFDGGVAGHSVNVLDGWSLSTDTGCAFMSIDGLSHAYKVMSDDRVKDLLDVMIEFFMGIDKINIKAQTHCTLTAARGMIRMYLLTRENKYLVYAQRIFEIYTESGMSYTYQNLNWWGRADSWTEPCAIVDSLMVATELYKITGKESLIRTAARIYENGLASAQRDNGGAGTDTVVCKDGESVLHCSMYEAWFCCTMRLAEGLWYVSENRELLHIEYSGTPMKNENGVYMDGDIVYSEINDGAKKYIKSSVEVDGRVLSPLLKWYKIPREIMENISSRVIFD